MPHKILHKRLFKLIVILTLLPGCGESKTTSVDTSETEPTPTQTADDLALGEMQQKIKSLIEQDRYDDASDLLSSLDLKSYVPSARSAANEVRPQYWGVHQYAFFMPYLSELNLSITHMIQFEQDAWVIPGTSDAQSPGMEQRWQETAMKRAAQFNRLLYEAIKTSE